MAMVVRSNMNAMNANRNLSMNNGQVAKSLEKLASGYAINRAGDDASGLAISEKMKAQIKGLEQASANSQDGISLVQTAEGAMTEIHSMLNRMVELATKSANGTIQDEVDREAIQSEVDALRSEIDRIADATNFNGIDLLNGNLSDDYDVIKNVTNSTQAVVANVEVLTGSVKLETVEEETADSFDIDKLGSVTFNSNSAAAANSVEDMGATNFGGLTANSSSGDITMNYELDGVTGSIKAEITNAGSKNFTIKIDGVTYDSSTIDVRSVSTEEDIAALVIAAAEKQLLETMVGDTTDWTMDTEFTTSADKTLVIKGFESDSTSDLKDIYSNGGILDSTWVADSSAATDLEDGEGIVLTLTTNSSSTTTGTITSEFTYDSTTGVLKSSTTGNTVTIDTTTFSADIDDAIIDLINKELETAGFNAQDADGQVYQTTGTSASTANASSVLTGIELTSKNGHDLIDKAGGYDETKFDYTADTSDAQSTKVTTAAAAGQYINNIDVTDGFSVNIDGLDYVYDPTGATQTNADSGIHASTDLDELAQMMTDNNKNGLTFTAIENDDGTSSIFWEESELKTTESIEVTKGSALTLQVGDTYDPYNNVSVSIDSMKCDSLGIDTLSVSDQESAGAAIDTINDAINMVSTNRANLGALQNRLEYTINNLDNTAENMTSANSAIRDTDMASEMMEYTKMNVLVQSAQSMLAQANQAPQQILSLLG